MSTKPIIDQAQAFPITFASPEEVIVFCDDALNSGKFSLYDWQKDRCRTFARARKDKEDISYTALIAANGSGKSQNVLAPCAVWMALAFVRSVTIVTTASGDQLDKQAHRFIKRLCEKVNNVCRKELGVEVFDIKYRHIFCNITHSYIDLFATDEPGKAEGSHPIDFNGEFAIIVDEAKTVSDEIFAALERCSGVTRRMDLSSPGDCSGYFYDICTHKETPYDIAKITAYECPHINKRELEWKIKKYGINDPLIRSSIFAEFTSIQDNVCITRDVFKKCLAYYDTDLSFNDYRAGLDLSAGGDETVLSVWRGYEQVALEPFRISDTVQGVKMIIDLLRRYKLKPEQVWADDGGIGRSMIDMLREQGWTVNRLLNQQRARDPRYRNRGTEMWFNFKRFVEEYKVKFLPDSVQQNQLTNRYYRIQTDSAKIMIEPKKEAKAKGHPSPDRADACVLAWFPYVYPLYTEEKKEPEQKASTFEAINSLLRHRNGPLNAPSSNVSNDGCYIKTDGFSTFNQRSFLSQSTTRRFNRIINI